MEQGLVKRRTVYTTEHEREGANYEDARISIPAEPEELSFFAWRGIQIVLIHTVAGILFGYNIGFVGPYYTFVSISQNCSAITTEGACTSLVSGQCVWSNEQCTFTTGACGGLGRTSCNVKSSDGVNYCQWNMKNDICEHMVGYTAMENGIFASGFVVGGCVGSLCAGALLSVVGQKGAFMISGLLACLSAVLTHVSTYYDLYIMVVIGRVIVGIACGILCVASPMYVEEMSLPQHRQVIGVFFQIACTFGIFFAALFGWILNPHDFTMDLEMMKRRQGLCTPNDIISVLVIFVGVLMRESPRHFEKKLRGIKEEHDSLHEQDYSTQLHIHNTNEMDIYVRDAEYSWKILFRPLFTSVIMCTAQQLTGINAIMNYAPSITIALGFAPLSGNLLVMTWNFVTVLMSIPLSSRFRAENMYIAGVFLTSASSLLTGMVLFPALGATTVVKHFFSTMGIVLFILFFELTLGSFFWTLSQCIFPHSFRAQGSGFTMMFQFLLNIIVNVGFPIAVEFFSGGPSADKDKGMSIVFIFFGCVGVASGAYLFKYLCRWDMR